MGVSRIPSQVILIGLKVWINLPLSNTTVVLAVSQAYNINALVVVCYSFYSNNTPGVEIFLSSSTFRESKKAWLLREPLRAAAIA